MMQQTLLEYFEAMKVLLENGEIDRAKESVDHMVKGLSMGDASLGADE